jgi:formylglycine-generating enzyme required for sulfatase activity
MISLAAFSKEVRLPKSVYAPMFRDPGEENAIVGPLLVDEAAVSNAEYLEFVKSNPEFARSRIPQLYSDSGYLSHWSGDFEILSGEEGFPVTNISWFAARKYCQAQEKRLPTIAEWEVLSDAQNPKHEQMILNWYADPKSTLRKVGAGQANKFGIKNAHGLIWEWVDNFSETIMSGDSRGGSSTATLFCGGAALKAKDPKMYAAFMRFAHRSSLNARYNSANLGFRCVKDLKDGRK